jgi:phage/plasmid-associated DNA primase
MSKRSHTVVSRKSKKEDVTIASASSSSSQRKWDDEREKIVQIKSQREYIDNTMEPITFEYEENLFFKNYKTEIFNKMMTSENKLPSQIYKEFSNEDFPLNVEWVNRNVSDVTFMKCEDPVESIDLLTGQCKVESGEHFYLSDSQCEWIDTKKWACSPQNTVDFFDALSECENYPVIYENPSIHGPLRVRLNLPYFQQTKKHNYDISNIKVLISELRQQIIRTGNVHDDAQLAVLLRHPDEQKNGYEMHKYTILFPYFIVDAPTVFNILMSGLFMNFTSKGVWRYLTDEISHNLRKVIVCSMGETWPIYNENNEDGYSIQAIYDKAFNEVEQDYEEQYLTLCSIRYNSTISPIAQTLHKVPVHPRDNSKRPNLPRKNEKSFKPLLTTRNVEKIKDELNQIETTFVLNQLDNDRCNSPDEWLEIGNILFNIGGGCPRALELWKHWTFKSEKIDPNLCEEFWQEFTYEMNNKKSTVNKMGFTDVYGFRTLFFYAKNDSIQEGRTDKHYNQWLMEHVFNLLKEALSLGKPTHGTLARIIHMMNIDRFVYVPASSSTGALYHYQHHVWTKRTVDSLGKSGIRDLKQVLKAYETFIDSEHSDKARPKKKDQLIQLNYDDASDTTSQVTSEKDGLSLSDIKQYENTKKLLKKFRIEIENLPFINKVFQYACKYYFVDEDFQSKLNTNRDIIGLLNGVFDFNRLVFRPGNPDDYITMQGDVSLEYNERNVKMADMFLRQLFPKSQVRDYVKRIFAISLQGGNRSKKIFLFTGNGNNGKSVLEELMMRILGGDLVRKADRGFLKADRANSSGGPTVELWRLKDCRYFFAEELGENESVDMNVLKNLSGNDRLYARTLHSEGGEFLPQFTPFIYCNKVFKIPYADDAFFNRFRKIQCDAVFGIKKERNHKGELIQIHPPEDIDEQFKKGHFKNDADFIDNYLMPIAKGMIWILIEEYKKYRMEGTLYEPEEVLKCTEEFRVENDVVLEFIHDCIELTGESDDKMTKKVMFEEFKLWLESNHPNMLRRYGKNTFIADIEQKFIKYNKTERAFVGVKIAQQE